MSSTAHWPRAVYWPTGCSADQRFSFALDMMGAAYQKAWLADFNLIPVLMVRARAPQPVQAAGTNTESC